MMRILAVSAVILCSSSVALAQNNPMPISDPCPDFVRDWNGTLREHDQGNIYNDTVEVHFRVNEARDGRIVATARVAKLTSEPQLFTGCTVTRNIKPDEAEFPISVTRVGDEFQFQLPTDRRLTISIKTDCPPPRRSGTTEGRRSLFVSEPFYHPKVKAQNGATNSYHTSPGGNFQVDSTIEIHKASCAEELENAKEEYKRRIRVYNDLIAGEEQTEQMSRESWDEVDELYKREMLSIGVGQVKGAGAHIIIEKSLESGAEEFAEHLLTKLGILGVAKLLTDVLSLDYKELSKLKEGDAFAKQARTEYQAAMAAFDCVKKARERVEELERECSLEVTPFEQMLRNPSPEQLEAIDEAMKLYRESEEGKAAAIRTEEIIHKMLESPSTTPPLGENSRFTTRRASYVPTASEDEKLLPEQIAKFLPLMTTALNQNSAFARSFEKLGNKLKALRHTNNTR
jgi:hypothetical protein